MRDVCLPSADLLHRVGILAPDLGLPERTVLYDGSRAPGPEHADVRFWVPAFLHADPVAARAIIEGLPKLQVIQTQSAGVDVIVPVVPESVVLCDGRGVHGSSTSEWALTAILSVLREFPRFAVAQQEGRWDYGVTDELAGKRVLVIGAGDVGEQLARRLQACDASVTLVGRRAREGVHAVSELPRLLPAAEVVVLIVPKTSETVGLVDENFLAAMPDNALLVNAARGPVVRTDALLAELSSGRLRAALDVTDPEPLPTGHPLWSAPNLLMTPHVAGSVTGFAARAAELIAAQLHRYDAGEPLHNVVHGEY